MEDRSRYVIGIDLGTTNSALFYIDTDLSKNPSLSIQQMRIQQLTGSGIVETLPSLPSFYYLANPEEFPYGSLCLPWDPPQLEKKQPDKDFAVGLWAQDQGSRVPTRLVQSAKSWLCNSAAARRDRILPFEAADETRRISPVEASSAYLRHIKDAWDYQIAHGDVNQELAEQDVVLTVPASFDEVARTLTVEAAKQAGFSHIVLLEEPQAAFYSWISEHEKDWPLLLKEKDVVLVCDVGGGTTDFSLIQVQKNPQGELFFQRMAVGDHLLLGGDNMDAAICHFSEEKFKDRLKSELSISQWLQLKHQSRMAKEALFSLSKDTYSLWIGGSGSRLIESGLHLELEKREIQKLLLDGFFEVISFDKAIQIKRGSGIRTMGLPFESDPSITKHLALFLKQSIHKELSFPTHVLFNGGAMKPEIFQKAILDCLHLWQKEFSSSQHEIKVLSSFNLDLAVARGAAYYGKVKRGMGTRIGGGLPRSYYMQIDVRKPTGEVTKEALTLIPRGAVEGIRLESQHIFQLTPNKPVSFQVYSSHTRLEDMPGDLVPIKEEEMALLPPLYTLLRYGKQKEYEEAIPVKLHIYLTEIGTLEIGLKSIHTDHHWSLEFQLRSQTALGNRLADFKLGLSDEIFEKRFFEPAQKVIEETFSLEHRIKASEVMNVLENVLERSRQDWPPSILRHLFDTLMRQSEKITINPSYEGRFWNLAGFLLRPGMGYVLDEHRIKELWKLILTDAKKEKEEEVNLQKYICFRRVGAGFNKGQQMQLFNALFAALPIKKGKLDVKKANSYQYQELIRTLSSFELVDNGLKIKLAELILARIMESSQLPADFWALGRIGARHLLYGSVANVIPRAICEQWISELTKAKGVEPSLMIFLLEQLARKTDQRELNVSQQTIEKILEMVKLYPEAQELIDKLHNTQELSLKEQEKIFGDSLPSGLVLELIS